MPIVRGERRKAKRELAKNNGKRTYRKKKDAPRLCADDVMARPKLKEYQTSYAEAMAKYGLKRGVEGSEAKHITGSQFYREVFVRRNEISEQVENLKERQQTLTVDIAALEAQQEAARTDYNAIDEQRRKKREELQKTNAELQATKGQLKTEKLKNSAAEVGTTIIDGIGAMIGASKVKRQEQQIANLQSVITDKDKENENLRNEIKSIHAGHEKEKTDLKQRTQEVLMRVDDLFPYVKGLLKWEKYCKTVGLNKEWTRALFTMKPYRYTGELYSVRYSQTFKANDVVLQFKPDKDSPGGFQFTINGKEDDEWFRQQRIEFYQRIGIDIEQTEQRQSMKI